MSNHSKKLRFGIVGLGVISYRHAQSIADAENAELVAASSRTEENRDKFSNEFDVRMFADFEEMLKQDDIDAVSICTPSGTHMDFGIKAAEAGKHVVVDKPIEVTVDRGQKLVDACKKNGVKLAVIYQNRFSNAVLQLKDAVDSGKIGKPVMARGTVKWFRTQEYYKGSNWRGTLELDGGGALINQSIHTLDLLIWILGDLKCVFGMKDTLTHEGIEAEDNLIASLRFANGALGIFEASTSIVPAQPRTIEINGSKGTAVLRGDQFELELEDKQASTDFSHESDEEFFLKQYDEIVNAILKGKEPPVSGEESLLSLAAVEAIYDSCGNHSAINPSKYISDDFYSSKKLYS
ncbi:Gfo/Idh/MocA family protein [Rhodohalobacter sulfatireducens]|uniref:Gfo/Idh/MocA family oxidoreductase n=1 Tax=Rhodohalobacter sulfatireducens TaxID=2911366 RepID=A0ABS9KGL2_9BACT|nr:Gfo/Idh/MocA family oxidoreductase [Rhodohalobacter sulfatireducens]MCG2589965.1 Gfo/Idh/MocA family oxidoreductase [Rhodohalobacter sulfatireducens]